jgi:hypothetical protein
MDDMRRSPRWTKDRKLKVDASGVHIPFLGIDVPASIHNRLMVDVPEQRWRRTGGESTSTARLTMQSKGLRWRNTWGIQIDYLEV